MSNSKKIIFSFTGFLLLVFLILSVAIVPYQSVDVLYYQDGNVRENLAGKIDFLVVGASQGLTAFNTYVLDEELGCFSYNLSENAMSLDSKYYFLEKELKRNPVKTVVLELSYDTLSRDDKKYAICEDTTIARLPSLGEKLDYLVKNVPLNDWQNVLSRSFFHGIRWYMCKLNFTESYFKLNPRAKGYWACPGKDVSLTKEEIQEAGPVDVLEIDYSDERIARLTDIVDLCNEYEVRLIFAVTPLSDAYLFHVDCSNFNDWIKKYALEHGCEMYDLNLVKDRYERYSDATSYIDESHMSSEGSVTATKALCDLIQSDLPNKDTSQLFYASYKEVLENSPYALND